MNTNTPTRIWDPISKISPNFLDSKKTVTRLAMLIIIILTSLFFNTINPLIQSLIFMKSKVFLDFWKGLLFRSFCFVL